MFRCSASMIFMFAFDVVDGMGLVFRCQEMKEEATQHPIKKPLHNETRLLL